jgi:hypothetical protein
VNGYKHVEEGEFADIVSVIKEHECDVVENSETCVNWRLKGIKQQYQQILSSTFKNSSLIVSTVSITHDKIILAWGNSNYHSK